MWGRADPARLCGGRQQEGAGLALQLPDGDGGLELPRDAQAAGEQGGGDGDQVHLLRSNLNTVVSVMKDVLLVHLVNH